ncbi:MAG: putative transposase, partial [Acidimicrobiales bacterium]
PAGGPPAPPPRPAPEAAPPPRLGRGEVPSRYAGAMLLYPFLCRLGADEVLASLPSGAARRYDAASLVAAAAFSFALGASSMEATKHLAVPDAGALIGAESFPHLRTLRPRLKAIAEASDPFAIQSAFAKAMLAADEHPPEVFYVDDHFVTYWGKAPVAKGYNIRRHLAEPGRADTFVVDDAWRAICFTSGEPRGLSRSLPEILGELREIVGERRVMVGFDRGGSYPKVFSAIAEANMDWVTWRRAPLVAPGVEPRRSWVRVDGKRRTYLLADETVDLDGYDAGPVRQLSAYEGGRVVFQVLTSSQAVKGAPMVQRLRHRWCIENTNKYLEDHHGIHWLCTYEMDEETDTAKVANPARRQARAAVRAAEAALAEAQRALGQQLGRGSADLDAHRSAMRAARDEVAMAKDDIEAARSGLRGVPAKLPANQLDPDARRARPRLAARALQMVCRLLAYNAELDLARRLNEYLGDPDEYRAITRNLLHLGGRIAYEHRRIVVTLGRPGSPRVARALGLLVEELNAKPAHPLGDRRPITYRVEGLSA